MNTDGIDILHIEKYAYARLLKAEAKTHDPALQLAMYKAMKDPENTRLFKYFYRESRKNYQRTKDFIDSMTTGPVARFPETKEQKQIKKDMIASIARQKCNEQGIEWLKKASLQGLEEATSILGELERKVD